VLNAALAPPGLSRGRRPLDEPFDPLQAGVDNDEINLCGVNLMISAITDQG